MLSDMLRQAMLLCAFCSMQPLPVQDIAGVCLVIAILVAVLCSLLPVNQSKAKHENNAEHNTQHSHQEACLRKYRCALPQKSQVIQHLSAGGIHEASLDYQHSLATKQTKRL